MLPKISCPHFCPVELTTQDVTLAVPIPRSFKAYGKICLYMINAWRQEGFSDRPISLAQMILLVALVIEVLHPRVVSIRIEDIRTAP